MGTLLILPLLPLRCVLLSDGALRGGPRGSDHVGHLMPALAALIPDWVGLTRVESEWLRTGL